LLLGYFLTTFCPVLLDGHRKVEIQTLFRGKTKDQDQV